MNGMSARTKQNKGRQLPPIHRGPSVGGYTEEPDRLPFRIGDIRAAKANDIFEPKLFRCPETLLMLAVLDDAIQCFLRYRGAKRRKEQKVFQSTKDWILSTESNWIFSFESVCEIVRIDPNYIRGALFRSGADQHVEGRDRSHVFLTPRAFRQDHPTTASPREHQVSSVPVLLRKAG